MAGVSPHASRTCPRRGAEGVCVCALSGAFAAPHLRGPADLVGAGRTVRELHGRQAPRVIRAHAAPQSAHRAGGGRRAGGGAVGVGTHPMMVRKAFHLREEQRNQPPRAVLAARAAPAAAVAARSPGGVLGLRDVVEGTHLVLVAATRARARVRAAHEAERRIDVQRTRRPRSKSSCPAARAAPAAPPGAAVRATRSETATRPARKRSRRLRLRQSPPSPQLSESGRRGTPRWPEPPPPPRRAQTSMLINSFPRSRRLTGLT